MPGIATLAQAHGTVAKFLRLCQKEKLPDEFYQKVIDDAHFRRSFVSFAQGHLSPVAEIEETDSQKRARELMGVNFLGLPEVAKHYGAPTAEQVSILAVIPAKIMDDIEAMSETERRRWNLVVFMPRNILAERKARNELFYKQDWYNNEAFSREQCCVYWRLMLKVCIEDSKSKTWDEQKALIPETDEVPTAQEQVYRIILHFLVTGERLFEREYVRTSSVSSDGNRVSIGCFGEDGLFIYGWSDCCRYSSLGVASSRRLGPEVEA